MDKVRIGLIGCGGISGAHSGAYHALSNETQVVATCDSNEDAARRRMADLGADAAHSDYRRVLERGDIDAVDLCLPHDLHAEVAVAAAEAGKHVFCEKPIATSQEEARRMIDAAARANVRLMIAYCERFSNASMAMKAILDEGGIGEPFLLRIDHNQWVNMPGGHWINDPKALGGGVVAGSGTHRLDLLRWFGGDVKRVASRFVHTGLTPLGGEDAAVISLDYEGGAAGEMVATWSAKRYPWYEGFLIYGREGMLHNIGGVFHSCDGAAFEPVTLPHDDESGFREEIRHFLRCVRDGSTPLTDGNEALKTLKLVEAVYAASQSDAWVEVG
jgi:predicted dehydrogenase